MNWHNFWYTHNCCVDCNTICPEFGWGGIIISLLAALLLIWYFEFINKNNGGKLK